MDFCHGLSGLAVLNKLLLLLVLEGNRGDCSFAWLGVVLATPLRRLVMGEIIDSCSGTLREYATAESSLLSN